MRRAAFLFAIALIVSVPAFAKEPGDYRVGDVVESDIITPVPLIVVDAAATEALKQKEAARIKVIFRLNTNAAGGAEADLRAAFSVTQSNLLRWVEFHFKQRQLDKTTLAGDEFRRVVTDFSRSVKGFPINARLAELWATGDDGLDVQAAVFAKIRDEMRRMIRVDVLPAEFKPGSRVRVVPVADTNETLSLKAAEKRGSLVVRTNLITLSRAKLELQGRFSTEESAVGRFVSSLLRVNCTVDEALTRQARAVRAEPVYVADNYAAGQVVARLGEVVTRKMLAALDQLRERTAVGRLQQQVVVEQARAEEVTRRNDWLVIALALVVLILALIGWRLSRRPRESSLLPALIGDGGHGALKGEAGEWQHRALAAEQKAERAHAAIRTGVFKQMAQMFGGKLLGGLVSQRTELLDAQKSAAADMAEMERRLDDLHAPLQERLRAYEQRVAELERALAAKGEENRELIKAKILLTRRQLDAERAKSELN